MNATVLENTTILADLKSKDAFDQINVGVLVWKLVPYHCVLRHTVIRVVFTGSG